MLFRSIAGGSYNCITFGSQDSSIIGGCVNEIYNSCSSTVIGGNENCIEYFSCGSSILGGYSNRICYDSCSSAIVGGYDNSVEDSSCFSAVIAGCENCISCCSTRSVIIGGDENEICGQFIFCYTGAPYFGYNSCQTRVCNSVIIGGNDHDILNEAHDSAIIAGDNNCIKGCVDLGNYVPGIGWQGQYYRDTRRSAIIGGRDNVIDQSYDSVIMSSCAYYYYNTVKKSRGSSIISHYAYIGAQIYNSDNSVIVGGSSFYGFIRDSEDSAIIAGLDNCMCCSYQSTIVGGRNNLIYEGIKNAIVGGANNCIRLYSDYASIIGGIGNRICNY